MTVPANYGTEYSLISYYMPVTNKKLYSNRRVIVGALAMCHVTMLCIFGIGVPVYVLPGRGLVYTSEL